MTPVIFVLLTFAVLTKGFDDFENSPDCDNDFAIHALALIQSKMGEIPRIQQIEAILSSCNKATVQKLTEASVHLLHKGVIPSQLTEQLQKLAGSQRKKKIEKFGKMQEGLQPRMKEVIDGIASISTNDSLSGNEKLMWISTSLMQLNKEERETVHKILHSKEQVKLSIYPASVVIPPSPEQQHNLLFHKNANPFSNSGSAEPRTEVSPSTFLKLNASPSRNLETSGNAFQKETPQQLGPPISALILNNGHPLTVGEVKHENKNIEDLDLLKTRNSIWAEAAKFLDQTTNIPEQLKKFIEDNALKNGVLKGNPSLITGLNIPANTFPLPTAAYEQLSKVIAGLSYSKPSVENRRYLPSRQRDAIVAEVRYGGRGGRVHTDIGPDSKIILPSIPTELSVPEAIPKVESRLATGSAIQRRSRPVTRFLGNELPGKSEANKAKEHSKTAETGVEMERKEVFGVPTLPRGGEFPTYPPPPPANTMAPAGNRQVLPFPSVRVVPVIRPPLPLNEKTPNRFPKFPSIDTVDPDSLAVFVPYKGPEDITGSRLNQKGDFNLQAGGRRRFVKIDLLNEH